MNKLVIKQLRAQVTCVLTLVLLSLSQLASAQSAYYWVGGSGNWSDAANHWATASGGSSMHSVPPTASDDVYFDGNSTVTTTDTVVFDQDKSYVQNWSVNTTDEMVFDMRGSKSDTVFISGGVNLINGDFVLDGGYNDAFVFNAGSGSHSIHIPNEVLWLRLLFDGDATWNQTSDIQASAFLLSKGNYYTNDFAINANSFFSVEEGQPINLIRTGNSTITTSSFSLPETGIDWNPGNTTFEFNSYNNHNRSNGHFQPTVYCHGYNTLTLHTESNIGTLKGEPESIFKLQPGLTHSIDSFHLSGGYYNNLELRSNNNGSRATVDLKGVTQNVYFAKISDIEVSAGGINAYQSFDLGNNVGVSFAENIARKNDSLALVQLYSHLNGENWTRNENWLTGDLDTWAGVSTYLEGRVSRLELNNNNIQGAIPGDLGSLENLVILSLKSNQLTSVPNEIGNLSNLEELDLSNNAITSLPDGIYELKKLRKLDLFDNDISSTLKPDIGRLTNLYRLKLAANNMTGSIPNSIGQLSKLSYLDLAGNSFSGAIPSELGSLISLKSLQLQGNDFSGEIPGELGDLESLHYLYLSENSFTGEIPIELGNLEQLRSLSLSANQLEGQIPVELGGALSLEYLSIESNNLSGSVPAALADLASLQYLYLGWNNLSGTIPRELVNMPNLTRLGISDNEIDEIPDFSGKSNFEISLWGNRLDFGSLLPNKDVLTADIWQKQFGEPQYITVYKGSYYELDPPDAGGGDKTLYRVSRLGDEWLDIQERYSFEPFDEFHVGQYGFEYKHPDLPDLTLRGANTFLKMEYPPASTSDSLALVEFYNATNGDQWKNNDGWLQEPINSWYGVEIYGYPEQRVRKLNLPANNLVGAGLIELSNLDSLQYLNLFYNKLSGNLNIDFSNLTTLETVYLGNNSLSDEIGNSNIGESKSLRILGLNNNEFYGDIPSDIFSIESLEFLNLNGNKLTGSIPGEVGDAISLTELILGGNEGNNLEGSIPSSIGSVQSLKRLELGNCQLTGEIPAEIGGLSNLEYLLLSNNSLTGALPVELGQLSRLISLELGSNQLANGIPDFLGNLHMLKSLVLTGNQFGGEIPKTIGNLENLETLSLIECELTGRLPVEMGNMKGLKTLKLGYNKLEGEIPEEFARLESLEVLSLHSNNFSGVFPKIKVSYILDVYNNGFSVIPDYSEEGLHQLTLHNNRLDFNSLIPNKNVVFNGLFQNAIGIPVQVYVKQGEGFEIVAPDAGGGDGTIYSWFKEGWQITQNVNGNIYSIDSFDESDTGQYVVQYTHPDLPNVTLSSEPITLKITYPSTLESDSLALVQFYKDNYGDNWTGMLNPWLEGQVYTWTGVETKNGRVVGLEFLHKNLISNRQLNFDALAGLTKLRILRVQQDNNNGYSSIPSSIGSIKSLEVLELNTDNLVGNIPSTISSLDKLTNLTIGGAFNSAPFPEWVRGMTQLDSLYFGSSNLSGPLPEWIGELVNLRMLTVRSNPNFTGPIPTTIGDLSQLRHIDFGVSNVSGTIPKEMGKLSRLELVNFRLNNLSGTIPPELGDLRSITWLNLRGNNLEGEVPQELGKLTKLTYLGLYDNNLSGAIPASFNNLVNLEIEGLKIQNNEFNKLPNLSDLPRKSVLLTNNRIPLEDIRHNHEQISGSTLQKQFSVGGEYLSGTHEQLEVAVGSDVRLSPQLAAESEQFEYQWYKNDVKIDGASNRILKIENATESDKGDYQLVIGTEIGYSDVDLSGTVNYSTVPWCSGSATTGSIKWTKHSEGHYLIDDFSFGAYAKCYGSGGLLPDGTLKMVIQNGEIYPIGTDQWGDTYTFNSVSTDGTVMVLDWENTYGESGVSTLTRTDGVNWPANLKIGDGFSKPEPIIVKSKTLSLDVITPISNQDSLALVALYHMMDGTNWNQHSRLKTESIKSDVNKLEIPEELFDLGIAVPSEPAHTEVPPVEYNGKSINWLTGPVREWHGVQVENGRVVKLDLRFFNLKGDVPMEIGKLKKLRYLNLAYNYYVTSLPEEMNQVEALEYIDISTTQIRRFPDLSGLRSLNSIDIAGLGMTGALPKWMAQLDNLVLYASHNRIDHLPADMDIAYADLRENLLDYADFERAGVTTSRASIFPQGDVQIDVERRAEEGTSFTLDYSFEGDKNQYTWYKDRKVHSHNRLLHFDEIQQSDYGVYQLVVRNSQVNPMIAETPSLGFASAKVSDNALSTPEILVTSESASEYAVSKTEFGYSPVKGEGDQPNQLRFRGHSNWFSSSIPIELGFEFEYFGVTYHKVYITDGGFLSFLPIHYEADRWNGARAFPGELWLGAENDADGGEWAKSRYNYGLQLNGIIGGYSGRLRLTSQGKILFGQSKEEQNAFVVEYQNIYHEGANDYVDLQIKLFEGSNAIEIHCKTCPQGTYANSQGIENQSGTAGYAIDGRNFDRNGPSENNFWSLNEDGVRFEPTNMNIAPAIVNQSISIVKTISAEDKVGGVGATDANNDQLTFSAEGGDTDVFTLNTQTGEITFNDFSLFNDEVGTSYSLDVSVTDGEFTESATVQLTVVQPNQIPVVAGATFTLDENSASNQTLGTITATDEEGDALKFSITGTKADYFSIGDTTGVLTVTDSTILDYELNATIKVPVAVTDGVATGIGTILVNLNDIADNRPPTIEDATFTTSENIDLKSKIGKVKGDDPDLVYDGFSVSYSIVSGNTGDAFEINDKGEITVTDNSALDFETNPTFTLGVLIKDQEDSATSTVTVNLTNLKERPVISASNYSIEENSDAGSLIGTINWSDEDAGDTVIVQILKGNENKFFSLSGSGELTINKTAGFNYELVRSHELTIQGRDRDGLTANSTFTVDVIDVNEAPVVRDVAFRLDQDAADGTLVGQLRSEDPEGTSVTFSIESGASSDLELNTETGAITVASGASLDYSTQPDYMLTINATDGELTSTFTTSVAITTLSRDQAALTEFYNSTGGTGWAKQGSWGAGSVDGWEGVTVSEGRVTKVVLPDNSIMGDVPESFKDITGLTTLDLSNNDLTSVPDLSAFPNLDTVDLSGNKLGMGDLLPYKDAKVFNYAPQGVYGVRQDPDTVPAGSSITITNQMVNGGNRYAWYLNDRKVGSSSTMTVSGINYSKMGDYVMKVTNGSLPGLEIEEQPLTILAETDFFGKIQYHPQGDTNIPLSAVSEGDVFIYRVQEGPFMLEDSVEINADGSYLFEGVVLGDFVVQVDAGDAFDELLQTYYVSEQDWLDADTLRLRDVGSSVDIAMINLPEFPSFGIGGSIKGTVSDQTTQGGQTNARIASSGLVHKAAVTLSRRISESVEHELVAYTETDQNGYFEFEDVVDGEYRINVQRPGVTMDQTTEIDYIVGAGGDIENNTFEVEAIITDSGIQVQILEELGMLKPYLKDLLLYPNPTEGLLTFEYKVHRNLDNLKAEIFTISGLKLLEREIDHDLGQHQAELDLTEFDGGVYFLRLSNGQQSISEDIKIIKK